MQLNALYGIFFTIIVAAACIAVVIYRSGADSEVQTSTVTNATPTLAAPTLSSATAGASDSAFLLTENATTNTLYAWGTATDTNTCQDLTSATAAWFGKFYRSNASAIGATGDACGTQDGQKCYDLTDAMFTTTVAGQDACSSATDTTVTYQATVNIIGYMADPTDASAVANTSSFWTVQVAVTDAPSAGLAAKRSPSVSTQIEMTQLLALDLGAQTVDFGALAAGDTSAEKSLSIENTGNENIDVKFSAESATWSCTSGQMNASTTHYSATSSQGFATATYALTTTATTDTAWSKAKATTTASLVVSEASKTAYWLLQIPAAGGAAGKCNQTATLTPVLDS